ncbi:MAG TPA: hypothetical protein VHV83_16930, partial [Armatimonadota bacterium]|nr:hypothetical protein [Armatimonadota bacterium]
MSTSVWTYIRSVIGFSLLLTLGTTLTLTAQDSPTPKIVTLRVGDTQHQVYTCKETVQTLLH